MLDIDVIGVVDLNTGALDLQKLYNDLVSLRRDHYEPNQKIVVQHTETDYYYRGNPVGFAIHNFLTILYQVDISLSQIVFVTTHNCLEDSIRPFVTHEKDVPTIQVTLVSRMTYKNIKSILKDSAVPRKNLKYIGLCLMGTMREHRLKLYQYLKYNLLLDQIQTSVNNQSNNMLSPRVQTKIIEQNSNLRKLGLLYSFPCVTNESWSKPIVNNELSKFANVSIDNTINTNIPASGHSFYSEFAVDIITETTFDCPSQFVSEKTLRPLLLKTPFLVFGPAYFLQYLKSNGFKTFDDLWDESYDLIENPQDRFIRCCNVVKDIAQRPLSYWYEVYQKIDKRLDHNRQVLLQYITNEFTQIHNKYKL